MKILIISSGYLPITGGHGGAIENLVNIYLNYNETIKDEITVYTVKNKKNSFDKQIYKNTEFRNIDKTTIKYKITQKFLSLLNKFYKLKCKNNYLRLVIKDLKKRKEENKYDVIIFENGQDFIRKFRTEINTKGKCILHLHNDYLNKDTMYSNEILEKFDEVWTVSKYIKNRVDEIKYTENKVKVLYNTIDYELFNKKTNIEEKDKLRESLKINKNDFVFLYVGRVMPEKGTLELVKAFVDLNKKNDNIKLLIVGGNRGLKNNDSYIELVKKTANNNVVFTGQVLNYELYKYYQISNIQVVPSKWNEAFGLIVLEGVTSGLPIICTNSGGIPEILEENALYVNRENLIEELQIEMEKVLKSKEKNIEMTRNYNKIIERFSKEQYCERFKELLKNN